jgi:hypothetical protein
MPHTNSTFVPAPPITIISWTRTHVLGRFAVEYRIGTECNRTIDIGIFAGNQPADIPDSAIPAHFLKLIDPRFPKMTAYIEPYLRS